MIRFLHRESWAYVSIVQLSPLSLPPHHVNVNKRRQFPPKGIRCVLVFDGRDKESNDEQVVLVKLSLLANVEEDTKKHQERCSPTRAYQSWLI